MADARDKPAGESVRTTDGLDERIREPVSVTGARDKQARESVSATDARDKQARESVSEAGPVEVLGAAPQPLTGYHCTMNPSGAWLAVGAAALLACAGCASPPTARAAPTLTPDLQAEQACIVHEIAAWNPNITFISAKCSNGLIVERTEPMLMWLFASPAFRAKYVTAVQVLARQMRELDAAMARMGEPGETRSTRIGELPPLPNALGW